MANWTTLIVGGSPNDQEGLRISSMEDEHQVCFEANATSAFDFINRESVDLVLCDQELNGNSGIGFLRDLKERYPKVIRVLSGRVDLDELVSAVNEASIHEYFSKPWHPPQFNRLIQKMRHGYKLANLFSDPQYSRIFLNNDPASPSQPEDINYNFDKLVFRSSSMADACNLAMKAAETDLPILIQGETRTFKAKAIINGYL